MSRFFIVALFVALVVCVMQTYAAPTEATTPNSIEEALKNAGESISKAFNEAKPKIDELLAKSQDFFESVGKKISDEASKMIPKSDEKTA